MTSIRAPAAKRTTTLTVAAKCRPLTKRERGRDIVRVNDNKEVIILDPDLSKDYLDRIHNRTKEKKYCFDHAFGPDCTNLDVYKRSISSVISGVVQGLNATVFAYGSTGSKTYTMVRTRDDPGLMVLSLHTVFELMKKDKTPDNFKVSCSYLEVYNEVIYDLFEKSSGHLELREDPEQGIIVLGLRCIKITCCFRDNCEKKEEKQVLYQVMQGKLALVDLAGSERATETNSGGQKLKDGANINCSLLALANCINTLGKQKRKGLAYVPAIDSLSGNSQTVMVATISPVESQYHRTVNTLKYADQTKEIKTHMQENIGTINIHVSDYQRMFDSLQIEICRLKKELVDKESQLTVNPAEKAVNDEL